MAGKRVAAGSHFTFAGIFRESDGEVVGFAGLNQSGDIMPMLQECADMPAYFFPVNPDFTYRVGPAHDQPDLLSAPPRRNGNGFVIPPRAPV